MTSSISETTVSPQSPKRSNRIVKLKKSTSRIRKKCLAKHRQLAASNGENSKAYLSFSMMNNTPSDTSSESVEWNTQEKHSSSTSIELSDTLSNHELVDSQSNTSSSPNKDDFTDTISTKKNKRDLIVTEKTSKALDLSRCTIREISSTLSRVRHLRALTIHNAALCRIPFLPSSLERLDLSRNVIQSTSGIERARNLVIVRLDHNALNAILPGFSHSHSMVELNLSHNGIRTLDGIQQLSNIQTLDLRFNQLLRIDELNKLSRNQNIRVFRAEGNDLSHSQYYRRTCIQLFPMLYILDSETLSNKPSRRLLFVRNVKRQNSKRSDKCCNKKATPRFMMNTSAKRRYQSNHIENSKSSNQNFKNSNLPSFDSLNYPRPQVNGLSAHNNCFTTESPKTFGENPTPNEQENKYDKQADNNIGSTKLIQDIVNELNIKINKLYSWHLVELDLVSRQQLQLNEMKSDIESTKDSASFSLPRQNSSFPSLASSAITESPQVKAAPQKSHTISQKKNDQRDENCVSPDLPVILSRWLTELDKELYALHQALDHIIHLCNSSDNNSLRKAIGVFSMVMHSCDLFASFSPPKYLFYEVVDAVQELIHAGVSRLNLFKQSIQEFADFIQKNSMDALKIQGMVDDIQSSELMRIDESYHDRATHLHRIAVSNSNAFLNSASINDSSYDNNTFDESILTTHIHDKV